HSSFQQLYPTAAATHLVNAGLIQEFSPRDFMQRMKQRTWPSAGIQQQRAIRDNITTAVVLQYACEELRSIARP
ncbi:hypothetical protein Dimus_031905, partial [Dionaea muscipula]